MTQDINNALGIASTAPTSAKPVSLDDHSAKVMARYKDGYIHARTIDSFGATIKIMALILGGLPTIAGIVNMAQSSNNTAGLEEVIAVAPIVVGLLVAGIGYVVGVLVQSTGQSMKAHFDCAVNGSHFLNDDQRAEVMSLD